MKDKSHIRDINTHTYTKITEALSAREKMREKQLLYKQPVMSVTNGDWEYLFHRVDRGVTFKSPRKCLTQGRHFMNTILSFIFSLFLSFPPITVWASFSLPHLLL